MPPFLVLFFSRVVCSFRFGVLLFSWFSRSPLPARTTLAGPSGPVRVHFSLTTRNRARPSPSLPRPTPLSVSPSPGRLRDPRSASPTGRLRATRAVPSASAPRRSSALSTLHLLLARSLHDDALPAPCLRPTRSSRHDLNDQAERSTKQINLSDRAERQRSRLFTPSTKRTPQLPPRSLPCPSPRANLTVLTPPRHPSLIPLARSLVADQLGSPRPARHHCSQGDDMPSAPASYRARRATRPR